MAPDQGFLVEPEAGRKPQEASTLSSNRPGAGDPNNRGRHSNPVSKAACGHDDGADSPTAGRPLPQPGPKIQRRLTPPVLGAIVAGYDSGRSLNDLAREFGVHHRTVADHLERLGIARRVNLPKLSAADVKRAASQYRSGESLATVGKALSVDASTVQRALKCAGVPIRLRPGAECH